MFSIYGPCQAQRAARAPPAWLCRGAIPGPQQLGKAAGLVGLQDPGGPRGTPEEPWSRAAPASAVYLVS